MDSENFQLAIRPDLDGIKAAGLDRLASGWCVWRYVPRDGGGKPAKVPHTPGGHLLKVSAPADWVGFGEVYRALESGAWCGVGLLLQTAPGLVGLDLDGCLDAGEVIDAKREIVNDFLALGGYVETSPSGTGLRQFLKGCKLEDYGSRGRSGTGLEVYDSDERRYLTVTGHPYPPGSEARISSNQQGLEAFIARWCDSQATGGGVVGGGVDTGPAPGAARTAADVLMLLKRHNRRGRVTRLLKGNLDDHNGDHSAADLDLCQEVAYFCRDRAVIDEVFRGSGLMRPKWDERRGKLTYGQKTINTALEKQGRNYDADQREKRDEAARVTGEASHLIGGGDDLRARRGWKSDLWALTELLVRDSRLQGAVFFDDFAGWPIVARSLRDALEDRSAPAAVGRVNDGHIVAVCRWFGRQWGLKLPVKDAAQAFEGWARADHRNPVRERLEALGMAWDGVPRLDGWLVDYCSTKVADDDGNDIEPYVRAVGARWLLGAVARGMVPGLKMDNMLVLEGRQGARKSSAARVLAEAVSVDAFREGFSLGGGGKDDLIALRGRLVVEWGELSGMGKRDREHLKNFLSTQTDSYRSVFGITESDWPRTAVFIGTTNEGQYLADSTGNRRFWPVSVGRIKIDDLRRDAPQIWGEAVRRYKAGERWWFDDLDPDDTALLRSAESEQARRIGGTLWTEAAQVLADKLIAGELRTLDNVPADSIGVFPVLQLKTWMADSAGVAVDDGNWVRVTTGLKDSGWESRKRKGSMVWGLTADRRDRGTLLDA